MSEVEETLISLTASPHPAGFWESVADREACGQGQELLIHDSAAICQSLLNRALVSGSLPHASADEDPLAWFDSMSVLRASGRRHTRLRAPIVRSLRAVHPEVEKFVASTVARYASAVADAHREVDFVSEFCEPVSREVAGRLIGLSAEQAREFGEISDLINTIDATADGDLAAARSGLHRLLHEVPRLPTGLVRRDDVEGSTLRRLGDLARANHWTSHEWQCNVVMVFTAGYLTSRNALSCIPVAMSRAPDANGDELCALVLTEYSPIQVVERYAAEAVQIGQTDIEKGARVLLAIGSATRQAGPELAFGRGSHFCAGARIARLEMKATEAALRALNVRLSESRVAIRKEPGSFGFREVWLSCSGPSACGHGAA